MNNIAIIPARGGSKRIPRKNIRQIDGKPLISFPILSALESKVFSDVFVSTDDEEIADIAREYGAKVPFVRDSELSNDFTSTVPVIRDAIERISVKNYKFDNCCCIYPTSIFVTSKDLIDSSAKFNQVKLDSFLISVVKYPYPIQRALSMDLEGGVAFLDPQHLSTRSQDLPKTYHDAAQFYWGSKAAWLKNDSVFTKSTGYLISSSRIQDIDEEEDLQRAEYLYRTQNIE